MRILIVDDHAAARGGLVALFEAQEGVDVVAEAENGREAVAACKLLTPDVVLMDVRMPILDGIEATREIKASIPSTAVVLITAYEHDDLLRAGQQAGASDFVFKGIPGAELVERVQAVARCT